MDENDAPDAPEALDADVDTEPVDDASHEDSKVAKANREARNLRKRLKELEPLAQRARELEESQKTETQRASDAQKAAEKERDDANQELMRLRVAISKGLTTAQAKRLIGSTEEELEEDADELLASFKSTSSAPPTAKPKESLRGGGDPTEEPEETDPAKLAALVRRGL